MTIVKSSDPMPSDPVSVHDAIAALRNVIEAAERALGDHVAPHDCFATGPRTGNPIADLIACPGCAQKSEIAEARTIIDRYKIRRR